MYIVKGFYHNPGYSANQSRSKTCRSVRNQQVCRDGTTFCRNPCKYIHIGVCSGNKRPVLPFRFLSLFRHNRDPPADRPVIGIAAGRRVDHRIGAFDKIAVPDVLHSGRDGDAREVIAV